MRKFIVGALSTAAASVMMLGSAGLAHADGDNYPGACLVARNHGSADVTITLDYPPTSSTWTIKPFQPGIILADRDRNLITSPIGSFKILYKPGGKPQELVYEPGRNDIHGCNGSWVLTVIRTED